MMFIRVGSRLMRTTDLRIDSVRTIITEDLQPPETKEERLARVAQKEREIHRELRRVKPNAHGLI